MSRHHGIGPDAYRHLNDDGGGVVVGIEEVARQIVDMNYGTHRLLSALVRAQRQRWGEDDETAAKIEAILREGYY